MDLEALPLGLWTLLQFYVYLELYANRLFNILQMEKQPRIQRERSAGSRTVISSQHPCLTALRIATVADMRAVVERSLDAAYQGP